MESVIFNARMKLAALRQFLRDRSQDLTEDEIDEILDEISKLTELIEILEKNKS